ncbi:hypothetical protein [Phenylobacterium deserti]|uniref:Uncharacterized protein n=1 Tax=Phenylobacterium deserti TaxID=1914756 RepID=A0A328ADQ1_9CAUL|nr:hypothetical protein [Phenylobacterium deserti]RAK52627.1 hypothetical protein DJ018_10510 [Phenylobacterium deserti]
MNPRFVVRPNIVPGRFRVIDRLTGEAALLGLTPLALAEADARGLAERLNQTPCEPARLPA